MNLRQLIYLREVASNGFSVSRAARRLHTSQPGLSQQILALERELGMTIFIRERNRLLGLTRDGEQIVARAGSALLDIDHIREYAKAATTLDARPFVIATTHTQARYVLPEVLSRFAREHPNVRLTLQHGNPAQIRQALIAGTADIGVTPYVLPSVRDIAVFECRSYRRIVLAPKHHPLTTRKQCSLRELAKHPLVTFEPSISARQTVLGVFEAAGLAPNVILSAIDADVVKACVERGLGLAALAEVAYDPLRDVGLALVKTPELFPRSVTHVTIHRKHHLPAFVFDFIELLSPRWTRAKVERELASRRGGATPAQPIRPAPKPSAQTSV
ncbi:MAG: LysR family transcriptional regulator [Burkholderiales bacterium]|nr:LysR family transcriptional regulator [Burkholderiales bacterium]